MERVGIRNSATGNMKYAKTILTQVAGFAAITTAGLTTTGCSNFSEMKPSKMFSLDNTWPFKDRKTNHTKASQCGWFARGATQ